MLGLPFLPIIRMVDLLSAMTVAVAGADPVSVATGAFAASGTLGATVLMLGAVVAYLWREGKIERDKLLAEIKALHEQAIARELAIQERLLRIIAESTGVITSSVAASTEMRTALVDVRDALEQTSGELKSLSERQRR